MSTSDTTQVEVGSTEVREPTVTAGATEVFALGHWEAMQISRALDLLADAEDGIHHGQAAATRGLARVFSSRGDGPLFTVLRTRTED